MKKIIIIVIILFTYQISYTQNNDNSLKEELAQILTNNKYPQVQHFTTIAYLYTGFRTSPIVPTHSELGHSLKPPLYGINYKPGETKTIISPDKKYKAFVFSPTNTATSICISNVMSKELVKIIPLFEQKLLHLEFYPKTLLFGCKEAELDIIHLHKLPLNKTDPEKIFTLRSASPLISYIPERDITLISGDLTDANPFNIVVLDAALKKYATLTKHTNVINEFAATIKAPLIASASDDGTVIIWKFNNQEFDTKISCNEILQHNAPVKCICINPDGKFIISGTHNNKKEVHFYVWNLLTKTPIFTFPLKRYVFDPIPIHCSWTDQGNNIDEIDTQTITLESDKFYYKTNHNKLFEVIAIQQLSQASNNNNNANTLADSLAANLKIENDSSTTLQSSDLSPDSYNQDTSSNSSSNENDNTDASQQAGSASTDNPASISSGRMASY